MEFRPKSPETRQRRTIYNAKSNEDATVSVTHVLNNAGTMYVKQRLQEVHGEIDGNPAVVEDFDTFMSLRTLQVDRKRTVFWGL